MIHYEVVKDKPQQLLSLTGFTAEELYCHRKLGPPSKETRL